MAPFNDSKILAVAFVAACGTPQLVVNAGNDAPVVTQPPGLAPLKAETMHDIVESANWQTVNDDVMGGRSTSKVWMEKDYAVFSGNLSPENNGGFASVRTEVTSAPHVGMKAVKFRVLGDGNQYQIRFRTDEQIDGPAYKHDFATTEGKWSDVTIPFADFELSFRGRLVENPKALEPQRIRQVGFLIANKQWGAFRLEIDWIKAVILK